MNLKQFDAACAKLPAAVLSIQWGEEHVWKIGGKLFAIASPRRKPFVCSVKASEIAREALKGRRGISPAPYLARAGWLLIEDKAMPDAEIADMIRSSHALIAAGLPKKLRATLGLAAMPCPPGPRRARNAP